MNVLIITGIFPPDSGGPATYVPIIARALVERGDRVTVITLSEVRSLETDGDDPFEVIRIRRGEFKPLRILRTIAKILRLGRRADLLYVNGLGLEAAISNFLLRKPMVAKVVGDWAWERAHQRGWVDEDFEEFQKSHYGGRVRLLQILRNFYARRMDRVIVPSRYLGKMLIEWWGIHADRVVVIPNAFEPHNGSSNPVTLPLETEFKVITVGRLIRLKRVDELIEVVAEIPKVGLVVVGDGPMQDALVRLAQDLEISDRVLFTGRIPQPQVTDYLQGCDLFVLNSTHEGLPHIVLEAMSAGILVIATDVGGTGEIIRDGENGILIRSGDRDALKRAIIKLLEDPELRGRFAKAGRETLSRFSLEAMVTQTVRVLEAETRV
ncbi:MAG: glycosyltransferase family 4 protein [Candidatus Bipolaricaulia bacterium]